MPSAARKPTTTDDSTDTPALAAAPKPRQRHDPKVKAQAELDRADAQLAKVHAEIDKHKAALNAALSQRHAAHQHRDYLAMHPLLAQDNEPPDREPTTDGRDDALL